MGMGLSMAEPWTSPFPCLQAHLTPLLEDIFCLLEEVAEYIVGVLVGMFGFKASELFKQAFLLCRQIGRSDHFNDDVLVAASAAMDNRYAHSFETEGTATLRTGRYLERCCLVINGRNLNLVANRSFSEANGTSINVIIFHPFKNSISLYPHDHNN